MTTEQQRIAIAEACGWGWIWRSYPANFFELKVPKGNGTQYSDDNESAPFPVHLIPDYLNDLNAMHEAEKMLWRMDWRLRDDFIDHLARIINPIHGYRMQDGIDLLDATAAQRAEAFLKTINKWTSNQPTEP